MVCLFSLFAGVYINCDDIRYTAMVDVQAGELHDWCDEHVLKFGWSAFIVSLQSASYHEVSDVRFLHRLEEVKGRKDKRGKIETAIEPRSQESSH